MQVALCAAFHESVLSEQEQEGRNHWALNLPDE
jgi:hypothetical protein